MSINKTQLNGEEKRKLKNKLGNKCVYCGCDNILFLTIDHKTPLNRGGTDDKNNLQVCCLPCNSLKGALTEKEFLQYMKALKILKNLCKIKAAWPMNVPLEFKQHFYPGFPLFKKPEATNEKQIQNNQKPDRKSANNAGQ